MTEFYLQTPISEENIRKLKVNDKIYLSGIVVTARDQAHQRAIEYARQGKPLPLNLEDLTVFHCGPVVTKKNNQWMVLAAGPTTSTRMDMFEDEFIRAFKPRIIIGKGGMGKRSTDAMAKYGAVYATFTGGAAVLAAKSVKRVIDVQWLDLGVPEAMWAFEMKEFGPLIVAIDSHANNLFSEVALRVEENRQRIYSKFKL